MRRLPFPRLTIAAALGLVLLAAQSALSADLSPLTITTAGGETVRFRVELALTDAERARGLMYRRAMPADEGMLFDFEGERIVTMWMRNTYIPLDMLFIGADWTIRHIAARTTPLSERTISSTAPVRYVVEINGGLARKLGLAPGDRVSGAALGGR